MELENSSDNLPDPIKFDRDLTGKSVKPAEPVDDPKPDRQARIDYLKSIAPADKPRKKWPFVIAGIVAVLIIAGATGYLVMSKPKAKKAVVNTPASTPAVVQPDNQSASTGLSHYISLGSDLNLSFDYPSNWTVSPPSGGNQTDQTITLNSPLVAIVGADNNSVTGRVSIRIRPATAGLTELSSGLSTAAQASVQFAYTKPSANQFQYPFLDFIHLAGGPNPSLAFEEVLITGNNKFAQGQVISDSTVAVDPIITANFYNCKTNSCTGTSAVPLSINNAIWLNNATTQQTLAIFQSLQIN